MQGAARKGERGGKGRKRREEGREGEGRGKVRGKVGDTGRKDQHTIWFIILFLYSLFY